MRPRNIAKRGIRWGDGVAEASLLASAVLSIGIVAAILFTLVSQSVIFFSQVSIVEFVTSTQWTPLFEQKNYGIAPLLTGTFLSTLVALSVAAPLGFTIAVFLSEFAKSSHREAIKPILELLAGVPTIVFGFFALVFITPLLQRFIPGIGGFSLLSAGIAMGLMIVPYIASLSEDALRSVPQSLRDGSAALGATRLETALRVVVPAGISGVIGAVILGLSRAVGETMIVVVAGGQIPRIILDPREQGATVTAFIAQVALGDLQYGSIEYQSIFAAGLALLLITLVFNFIALWLQRRYREAY